MMLALMLQLFACFVVVALVGCGLVYLEDRN